MYIPQASRPLWFWLFCSFWSEASFGTQRVQRRGFSRNGRQGPGRSHPHWDWWWWAHPWSPHHPPAPRCQHLSGTPGSKNRSFYVCDLEKMSYTFRIIRIITDMPFWSFLAYMNAMHACIIHTSLSLPLLCVVKLVQLQETGLPKHNMATRYRPSVGFHMGVRKNKGYIHLANNV